MATKIVTKNSSTASAVPTASDLVQGELAVNVADKRLFTEDNGGAIVELGTNPSSLTVSGNIDVDGTTNLDVVDIDGAVDMASTLTVGTTIATGSGGASGKIAIAGNTATSEATHITFTNGAGAKVFAVGGGQSGVTNNGFVIRNVTDNTFPLVISDAGAATFVSTVTAQKLVSTNGVLELDDNGSHNGIINSPASLFINIDSDNGSTGEDFVIGKDRTSTSGGTELFRVQEDGNVGIGTSSPAKTLEVNAGTNTEMRIGTTTNGSLQLGHFSNGAFIGTDSGTPAAADLVRFGTGGSERLRIDSSGNLIKAGGVIKGERGTAAAPPYTFSDDTDTGMFNISNADLGFSVGGSERMRIDSSGNLLIGKTTTGVAGAGTVIRAGGELFVTRAGDVMNLNRLTSDGEILVFRKDGVSVGSISTNANSLPSDRNFKKNITDLTLGLDFVKSLSPKTYNFKIDDEGQAVMAGLIAQEVEESLTAAGVERNSMTLLQHEPTEDVNESDYKMDYVKFVPVLINAMKEQQTLIESLTARIAALEE